MARKTNPGPEPLSNVRFVCPAHTPKAGGFTDKPMESFVGKLVKLAFPVDKEKGQHKRPHFEHMWVEVERIEGDELIGRLDNDPLYVTEYVYNDLLAFKIQEIEEVYDGR